MNPAEIAEKTLYGCEKILTSPIKISRLYSWFITPGIS